MPVCPGPAIEYTKPPNMETRLSCQICRKTFTQKSSLIRHSGRCTVAPAPSLRQKSCRSCTTSKTKCDLRRPKCSRCERRGMRCEYIIPMTRGVKNYSSRGSSREANGKNDVGEGLAHMADAARMSFVENSRDLPSAELNFQPDFSVEPFGLIEALDVHIDPGIESLAGKDSFASITWPFPGGAIDRTTLLAPNYGHGASINTLNVSTEITLGSEEATYSFSNIHNDWLLWNPGPDVTAPPLVRHSMETLLRVLKTWPKIISKGFQTPPMLHFTHTRPETLLKPMANCITIATMWAGQSFGTTELIRQTIIQEMWTLFEQYQSMDEFHLLSVIQALVMYTTMLMFPGKGQSAVSLIDPAILLCLQRVTSYIAGTGLILSEERDNSRPSWESWVHVTAKRRAVFSLYLLYWSYSVYHGLESFACNQLGFMPAPAPKFLWQAESRKKWEGLYVRWLAQWVDGPYMMSEFSAIQAGTSLEPRTEMWLEDADELGILFFSIVNATNRGQPRFDDRNGIPILTV